MVTLEDVTTVIQSDHSAERVLSASLQLVDVDEVEATVTYISDVSNNVLNPSDTDELAQHLDELQDSRTATHHITEPEIVQFVHQLIADFETEWETEKDYTDTVTFEPTTLVYRDSNWGVTAPFEIASDDTFWVDEFGEIVVEESQMIDSAESLRSMSVRISIGADWNPFDYTIYFATDEPHTYWADCETLEDYCEMVAENRDDITVDEMLEKDEYQSHTHLMNNQDGVNEWFEPFVKEIVSTYITSSEAVEVHPTQFNTEFDGYRLTGSIIQDISD